jgi:uncharacterized membrane protein
VTQEEINQREWGNPANWSPLTYSSPRDTRFSVPKRKGFGVTANFGHSKYGKIFAAVLWCLIGASVLAIVIPTYVVIKFYGL